MNGLDLIIIIMLLILIIAAVFIFKLNEKNKQLVQELATETHKNVALNETISNYNLRIEDRDNQLQQLQLQEQEKEKQIENLNSLLTKKATESGDFYARGQLLLQQLHETKERLKRIEKNYNQLNQQHVEMSSNYSALNTELTTKEQHFNQQLSLLENNKLELSKEFQRIAGQLFEEKNKLFNSQSQISLQSLLQPLKQQIEQFQQRVNEIHNDTIKGNTSLETELKKLVSTNMRISDEAHNLATALTGNKKITGNWGEMQLEQILQNSGLVKGVSYLTQTSFYNHENKKLLPDVIIKLPDNKQLVVDSKVSLVAYEQAVITEDKEAEKKYIQQHVQAIKNHIDDLASKNYSKLKGLDSPSFVFMFIPIEPAYIIAIQRDKELFNYAYRKNIMLVSYTTLVPILSTVANLWKLATGNQEAKNILKSAGDIYNQVCVIAERLSKLGNALNTANRQYNETVTGLTGQQGLYSKIEKFKDIANNINRVLPNLSDDSVGDVNDKLLVLDKYIKGKNEDK